MILLFFVFMPMFSNYAALLTKDVLFADAFFGAVGADREARGLRPAPVADANAERAGEKAPVLFARHDWLLFALAAMGSTFLRNGGLVFPLAACMIAAAFCAWDAHVARRAAKQTGTAVSCVTPRFRWVGVLAVLALCLASNMYFTKVFYAGARHHARLQARKFSRFRSSRRLVSFKSTMDLNSGVNPTVKEARAPSWRRPATVW